MAEQSMNDLPVYWMNEIVSMAERIASDSIQNALTYLQNEKNKAIEKELWFRCAFIRDVEFNILTDKTIGCAS